MRLKSLEALTDEDKAIILPKINLLESIRIEKGAASKEEIAKQISSCPERLRSVFINCYTEQLTPKTANQTKKDLPSKLFKTDHLFNS